MDAFVFRAVKSGDKVYLERAISKGEVNSSITDDKGNTLLHLAVELKKNEIYIVQMLLDINCDPNAQNRLGATPLHYVPLRKDTGKAIAELLLSRGANPNVPMRTGHTPLHIACEKQKPELVLLYCQHGAFPTALDEKRNSPLHAAFFEQGRDTIARDIIDTCISHGGNPQEKNSEGNDIYLLAAQRGYTKVCQLLVQRNLLDGKSVNSERNTAFHEAAKYGHSELLDVLLGLDASIINYKNLEGDTPLHLAAKNNHSEAAVILLRRKANVLIQNNEMKTPFDLATSEEKNIFAAKNPELIQAIRSAIPKVNQGSNLGSEEKGNCTIQ